jgi:glycosyltransferase involved in cell wall biosynthesis
MKIVHLLRRGAWNGGVESYVLGLVARMRAEGQQVEILVETHDPSVDVNVTVAPEVFRSRQGALATLQSVRPDIVHVHNLYDTNIVSAVQEKHCTVATCHGYQWICPAEDFYQHRGRNICDRTGGVGCIPITLTKRCLSLRPAAAFRQLRRVAWASRNLEKFSLLIAPSAYTLKRYLEAGVPASLGMLLPYFCPEPPQPVPRPVPEKATITFLGRVRDYKGYDIFVEVLANLPGVRGIMAGDFNDGSRAHVHDLARQRGCLDRVDIRGWVGRDGLVQLMAETSVFVFPSIWPETMGIVGVEAMAHGVPVVAFRVGGVGEWLQDNVTGMAVTPKDVPGMVTAIDKVLRSATLMRCMGEAALGLVASKFSYAAHVEQLNAGYARARERFTSCVSTRA